MTLPAHDVFNAPDWWRQAVVYQIYPRSFADANADGIGDLRGITSRVGYLRDLGIDAVWLSPFYPSALADGGYDVDDYRDVDPKIGTLADFDEMVAALHDAHIKVVVDIVPNHSSDRHEWFRAALAAGKGSPERERYIFRDGRGEHGELPPNNWPSIFGGGAWERVIEPDGTPGQWYLHLFAKEQPDWNWDHPDVHADFLETLRFWSDRGVDGFRVDVAHGLKKNLDPAFDGFTAILDGTDMFDDGQHPLWDRDEVHDVYAEWREVFNQYDPPRTAVAEAWVSPHRQARYSSPEGLGQTFNFDLLRARFDSGQFHEIVERNLEAARLIDGSTTWVFSNHDVVRHATRYGLSGESRGSSAPGAGASQGGNDGKQWLLDGGDPAEVDAARGLRRARAATLFMLALPGSAYLYQGEELGLQEVGVIPPQERQDPAFFRSEGAEIGRDGCRVPLPWSAVGASFGFGHGPSHLPQPTWFDRYAVDAEATDPDSTLTMYRRALALRRELECEERLSWLETPGEVLGFVRPNGWRAVTNFGTGPVPLPEGEVLISSGPLGDGQLPGETTVWLR